MLLIPATIATVTFLHRAYKRDEERQQFHLKLLEDHITANISSDSGKSRFPETHKVSSQSLLDPTLKTAKEYMSLPGDIKDFLATFYNGDSGARASGIRYVGISGHNFLDALPVLLEIIAEDRERLKKHGNADITRNMVLTMILGVYDNQRSMAFARTVKESIAEAIGNGWTNPKDIEYYKTMYDAADSVLVMRAKGGWANVWEALQCKPKAIAHAWQGGVHPCDEALRALGTHDTHHKQTKSSGFGL